MTNMRPQKSKLLKVVILGEGGVGKSALLTRFVSNRYEENNFHTIGVEFMNKDIVVDGERFTLQVKLGTFRNFVTRLCNVIISKEDTINQLIISKIVFGSRR